MNRKARRGAFLTLAALAACACGDDGDPSAAPSEPVNPARRINVVLVFGGSLTLLADSYVYGGWRCQGCVRPLERMLRAARGPGVAVRNAGRHAESLQTAAGRFEREIGRAPKADVVIILEGTNDLLEPQGSLRASAVAASSALERMLDLAAAANVTPIVATIPPIRETSRKRNGESTADASAAVSILNGRIRQIAQARGIPLVDVEQVIRTGDCPGTDALPCLNASGYHLTEAGYALITHAFFNAIQDLR